MVSDMDQPTAVGTPPWIRFQPAGVPDADECIIEESTLLGDIDLRDLRAKPEMDDDAIVLMVSDGDNTIVFQPGVATAPAEALAGARRLAAAAAHYADLLAVRAREDLPDSHMSAQ